ncbi:hypothetical protein L210DRAFT_3538562 [Boletus edulis BED1]|uniref:Fumarylacetoacetase-like C-terminal domain-containing protein n=1 Tax=Boletus edulis BED1 TaxID=1328754 RepID=A0AAD4BUW5_BOLED|nr:hypothetical protein L210DRAFT_3538562 [Boletus edulis BED1]
MLTIVIRKTAKNVSEAEVLDYVLGYTAANDWGFSKGFGQVNESDSGDTVQTGWIGCMLY